MSNPSSTPVALTLAGADSSGGAGVYADLKTFAAWGVHGTAVITAVTAQNSQGCEAVHPVPEATIKAQFDALYQDMKAPWCKIGMLGNATGVGAVADLLQKNEVRAVCDPVLRSTTGRALLDEAGAEKLKSQLLPHVFLLTPNLPEAEHLCGVRVTDRTSQKEACLRLVDLGVRQVLLKGGHHQGDPVDVYYDGTDFLELHAPRQNTPHTHGTGCVLSAAITAGLTLGLETAQAVVQAHAFVQKAIFAGYPCGAGAGPINPLFELPSFGRVP